MINTTPCQPIGNEDGQYLGALARKCGKCGDVKPISEYGKFHRGPGGYNHKCTACCRAQGKAWRAANREKANATSRKWVAENPEKRKKAVKEWKDANKPATAKAAVAYQRKNAARIAQSNRDRYEKLKPRLLAISKQWAEKNPDKVREKGRAWAKRNPDKVAAKCSRRRAKLRAVAWADRKAMANVYRDARAISKSTGRAHEVDHIYPLNGLTVSGLHVPENLMVVDSWTNRSKKNKLPGHLREELWNPEGTDVFKGEVCNA